MFYNVNGLQYLIRRNTGAFENGTVASLMEGLEQQTEAALANLLETLDSLK